MAPLPHNSTDIWYLDYSTCGHDHTLAMRSGPDQVATDIVASFDAFLAAHAGLIYTITPISLRHQLQGTNVSFPVAWTGDAFYGDGVDLEKDTASYFDYVGRTADGRRVRAALFGLKIVEWGGNFRVTPVEKTQVGTALDALTADGAQWVSISGGVPVWNRYANSGINAYWRNRIR